MKQKKQLHEQIATHTYRQQKAANAPLEQKRQEKRPERRDGRVVSRSLERVVTIPNADPSTAWNTFASRQEELRRTRARPRKYVKLVPRTYAQTGSYANVGRTKTLRRSLTYSSPIPRRSGRRVLRRSFIWKLLSIFLAAIALALGVNIVFGSNAFRIDQVGVTGTHNAEIIRSIQHMEIQGQNIFLLNVASLTEQIEALPQVDSVTVSKQLPNQLTVAVSERVPIVYWQTSSGTYSIDKKGIVVAAVSNPAATTQLNIVVDAEKSGKGQAALHPGAQLDRNDIVFATDLFGRLPKVLGNSVFRLRYDGTIYANTTGPSTQLKPSGSFVVESQDGWRANLGDASDSNPLQNRLLELQQILLMAQKQHLALDTIDLRYGLHPVYTVK